MESIETLIPDNEGNHLVVVLTFYDNSQKTDTFQIPSEFADIEIADISIEKLELSQPLGIRAFFKMCQWLIMQFSQYSNTVFFFICSTDPLETNHDKVAPELYRWNLFEALYKRYVMILDKGGIDSKEIIVGPNGYQTYARIFYRASQTPVIHLVVAHLNNKYNQ